MEIVDRSPFSSKRVTMEDSSPSGRHEAKPVVAETADEAEEKRVVRSLREKCYQTTQQ